MGTNSPPLTNLGNKLNFDIGIHKDKNGLYETFVLNAPYPYLNLKAKGKSREEAIKNLYQRLQDFLKDTEIVNLEIEIPQPEHPWMKFAGMFENDPLFEKVLEAIQDYRNEIDAEEE